MSPSRKRSSSSSPRARLRELLAEDETWRKYRRIVKNSWPVEFDGFEQEIMDIQKARPIRLLGGTDGRPTGKKLVIAIMADQSYRSRAVEIAMMLYRVSAHLNMVRNLCRKHITVNYSSKLASWGLRGVRERDALITSLFGTADELITKYETLMELADWVIADVDAGGFATQKATKALEIATKREYGV